MSQNLVALADYKLTNYMIHRKHFFFYVSSALCCVREVKIKILINYLKRVELLYNAWTINEILEM